MPLGQAHQPAHGQGQVSLLKSFSTEAEKYTRHLSAIIGADKAWRFGGRVSNQNDGKSIIESKYI